MAEDADPPDRDLVDLCVQARERIGTAGSFRVRVLLDMVLIELAREAAAAVSSPRSDSQVES
ncbi:MAG: hypothetical protein ABW179_02605 [Methylobacterium sp.]